MNRNVKFLVRAAIIAAMYVVLTYMQNIILPSSTTMAIQFRVSEALCVLAFFTPAAIPGLSIGCFVFNLTYSGALPLDILVGTAATVLACTGMYLTRRVTFRGVPILGLLMPAVCNALLVGWELTAYIGGGFWMNALYVAIGELAVLLTLGWLLYGLLRRRGLASRIFRA